MGRKHYYSPGQFSRICDRTGFRVLASDTKMEWDNLIVRKKSWEIRQPQDFVRGVQDDQNVPDARIRPNPTFIGPAQSMLSAAAVYGQAYVQITAPFQVFPGNTIGIMLNADLGIVFLTTVLPNGGDFNSDFGPDFSNGAYTFINPPLPGPAAAGNLVTNFSTPEIQPSQYGASNGL